MDLFNDAGQAVAGYGTDTHLVTFEQALCLHASQKVVAPMPNELRVIDLPGDGVPLRVVWDGVPGARCRRPGPVKLGGSFQASHRLICGSQRLLSSMDLLLT